MFSDVIAPHVYTRRRYHRFMPIAYCTLCKRAQRPSGRHYATRQLHTGTASKRTSRVTKSWEAVLRGHRAYLATFWSCKGQTEVSKQLQIASHTAGRVHYPARTLPPSKSITQQPLSDTCNRVVVRRLPFRRFPLRRFPLRVKFLRCFSFCSNSSFESVSRARDPPQECL